MRSTIKDVAKLAGVSIKTVSNVINNNSDRFSDETRDRVSDAVRKLNYHPNRAAQSMRRGATGLLAFAIPDIRNPYFSEIGREIINTAKEHGYSVLFPSAPPARLKTSACCWANWELTLLMA